MASDELSFIHFAFADRPCALPLKKVLRVIAIPRLEKPPGLPALFEGLLNLSGEIIPVIKITQLFGMADLKINLYTQILVINAPGGKCALLIDHVEGLIQVLPQNKLKVEAGHSFQGCIESLLQLPDRQVALLNIESLLMERDRELTSQLKAFRAAA